MDSVLRCFQVCPNSSNNVTKRSLRRCNLRFKRLRLSMCGIYQGAHSRARAASKLPRKKSMAEWREV
jgi:hypothetical protein